MRWKWILSIVVVLIVMLMVTVYAILSSYNFNNLKPKIAQAVKNATGRELMLGGNIELQISLTPALVVEDVNFQNAPWGSRSELAKIRRLEVQVAVLPLISGIIEVKRLILVEPDILIETSSSGKSNLDFETKEKPAPAEPKEEGASEGEVTVSAMIFNEVRIEKGTLTYKDGQSGQTYAIALESLLAIAATDGPVGLEFKGSYNKNFCHLKATLGPLAALTDPDAVWPVEITARAVGTTVTINGAIKDPLNGKGLDLTVNAKGQSVPDLVKVFDVTDVPDVGPFKIAGKLTDPGGRLTVKNLDLLVGTEDLARVKLTGVVEDLQALQGIELDFAIQGKDLENLEKITDQSLPLKGPFNATGRAVCSEAKNYKFSDLKLSFGESELTGSAEINLKGEHPQITAVLSSRKLDLRPILLKEKEGETGSSEGGSSEAQAKQGKVFPNDPLALDGLKQGDASVKIQAENMLLPGLALDNVTVHLLLQGGRLTVKPLRFAMSSGTTDGYLAMRPQGKATAVAMALKIDHLDLGLMLNKLGINNVIEGQLDVDVDLEGEGSSVAGLMAGLNGKTVLVMSNGSIDNKLINLLGADLGSSLFRLLNPFEGQAKRTELNCIVGGLDIKDGLAQTTALVLDTTQVSVVGHGKVNLKTEELDLSLKPSPKKGIGVKGIGKLSLSLGELTKSLRLSGTLTNPSVTIDATGTFLAIGKAVGGLTLFGPVGLAAALASGKIGDKDLCLAAIEAAKNGDTASGNKKPEEKSTGDNEATGAVGTGTKELLSK